MCPHGKDGSTCKQCRNQGYGRGHRAARRKMLARTLPVRRHSRARRPGR
jgi:hypothetical protein